MSEELTWIGRKIQKALSGSNLELVEKVFVSKQPKIRLEIANILENRVEMLVCAENFELNVNLSQPVVFNLGDSLTIDLLPMVVGNFDDE